MTICGTCAWYEPTRNPETGRVLRRLAGNCTCPYALPAAPKCVFVQPPPRTKVWHDDSRPCPAWATKKKTDTQAQAQQALLHA